MSYHERIFREIKKSRRCFLNWDFVNNLKLGEYGYFNGREASFDWQGNLASTGIDMNLIIGEGAQEEKYRTSGKVNISFDISPDTAAGARVNFRCKHAFAYEGFEMRIERVNMEELRSGLFAAIGSGKLKWQPNYLIVTQIWRATSFTAMVSGGNNAEVNFCATKASRTSPFNLANPSIGIKCEREAEMGFLTVAQKSVVPFFITHRVAIESGEIRLKQYGDDFSWF